MAIISKSIQTKLRSLAKFSLILVTYAFTFVTMIQIGLWLADVKAVESSEFQDTYQSYTILNWLWYLVNFEWDKLYLFDLGVNTCLVLIFICQHTFLSPSYLQYTKLWAKLHSWGAEKIVYTSMTGIALQVMLNYWKPIPVEVWSVNGLRNYFKWVHIFAWALLYGTTVMLDLPDMIGLTQVAICSPTMTAKSPDLQRMYDRQRHMGLIPFILIFWAYPYMSLDRLLLSIVLMVYTFRQFRSDSCYEYTKNMKRVKKYRLD